MSFRTILVPVNSPEVSKSTLETALLVAERWCAHLDVLHVRADPRGLVPYTGEGMDGSMIEEIMEVTERESGDRAIQTKKMFDAFCAEKGLVISNTPSAEAAVTVSWNEEAGREDEVVSLKGRLYDLVVVGRPIDVSPLPSPITLEAALHDTGRPILVAPPEAPTDAGGHIAIAWEASPEAARTIGVSIQALSLAREVTILAPQLSQPLPLHPSELVDRLLWHGITGNVREFAAGAGELGAAFLSQAEAVGADMLVKGAYSQSRLRQMILGGRTRHILKHTTIPTLLAK
ncbi:MAG: universal stress protein [Pseudomonadota bacterium]|nr:universal stress protein [Pseudomonadota bacterium]